MGQGANLSPHAIARAFRARFPRYRADLADPADLYKHLRDTYPKDIGLLVDPLLDGSESLPAPPGGAYLPAPGDTAEAYRGKPLPTTRATGNPLTTGADVALRVVPPLAVGVATSLGALPTFGTSIPAGLAATGGAAAAGAGVARRMTEALGLDEPPTPGQEAGLIATDAAFGMVPGVRLPAAIGPVVRAGTRAAEGAGLAMGQQQVESQILDRPAPTLKERLTAGAFGTVFGGGLGAIEARGIAQHFERAAEQLRQRTLTREGLAGTITRIAADLQAQGVDELAARKYAKAAARALYQGREMPPPPQAVPPPEEAPHGPFDARTEALGEAMARGLEQPPPPLRPPTAPGEGTYSVGRSPEYRTPAGPAIPPPPGIAEGPLPAPEPRPQPTPGEAKAFGAAAKRGVRQQVRQLAPPMEAPLGKPSPAMTAGFARGARQGAKQAVTSARAFTRLDEPAMPTPPPPEPPPQPSPSDQGAAAGAAYQRPGGSIERAAEAARMTLPKPPLPFKEVVLTGPEGYAVGMARVPDDYPATFISEAEYNSLYAPPEAPPAPEAPPDLHPLEDPNRGIVEFEAGLRPGAGALDRPVEFAVPPGDLPQLRQWMAANQAAHGGESFYRRASQALARKDPTRAWQVIQSESLRRRRPGSANKARAFAELRGEAGSIREQVGGERGTTRIPQPRPVSRRQLGQLTIRASGLKDVGDLPERTTIMALPPEVQQRVIARVDRARLGRLKGNVDTDYRLFRQVAQQVLDSEPRMRSISRALGLTPEELAAGWTSQVTEAARVLQRLSALSREIPNIMEETAAKSGLPVPKGLKAAVRGLEGDSADEGLQKLYGGLFVVDPREALEWARRSAQAMHEVHAQHLLERGRARSKLAAYNDLRRAGLTGTIAAFWRNAAVGGARWSAGILSDAIGAILSVDPTVRRELAGRAKDRLTAAPHVWNMVARPWASSILEMWPGLAKAVTSGRDPRKTLRAIQSFDDAEGHFLGLHQPDLPQSTGLGQYVRLIQTANRAQEYPLRALAADLRMRQLVRRRGFDPNKVLTREGDLERIFGSPEAAERAVQDAVAFGLDFTFAGDTITGTTNKALIDTINEHPWLSAIQAFPRYAWSAAPRFVWDHSPGILLDMAAQTLSGGRIRLGQRFMRGQQVAMAGEMLGRRETRLHELSLDRGRLLQERLALTKERAILKRRIGSLEKKADAGTITSEQQATLGTLQRQIRETNGALNGQMTALGKLQQEERILKDQVRALGKGYAESASAAAPESYGEAAGKVAVGMGLWAAAHAIRSSEDQADLPWYKIRAADGSVVDTRAFGPLTFYLFFGDLTADIGKHTDVREFRRLQQEKIAAGDGSKAARAAASVEALRESYHGKYTEAQALREGGQLVFGLSPAGGVTATFYDMVAPDGLTVDNALENGLRVVGEWLAGPLQPLTDASNLLSMVDPGEATIRDAGMIAPETPYAELAQPLTKIPVAKQMFPEQYSQTTGEVVASQTPALKTLGGITLSKPPNAVESVLQAAGVPGREYYLPRLRDVGLTQQLAKVHADSLRQMYDEFIRGNEDWDALETPEERRTYLTMAGGPLSFARALTWATMQDYGEERLAALRQSPAAQDQARRQLQVLERWSQDPSTMPPPDLEPPPTPGSRPGAGPAMPAGLPRPPGF